MWLKITNNYTPNFSSIKRTHHNIKYIVIHYTGMKSESKALLRLCDKSKKVSAHYFIKNNGEIINLVPDLYEAWHAGKSRWKNFKSLNKYSIGIEINNPGHGNRYLEFKYKQIFTLKKLLKELIRKYKIKKYNILGHSDIAPDRKTDPGEKFPWEKLAKNNLSIWHNLNKKKIKLLRNKKIKSEEKIKFLKNLKKIGYSMNIQNKILITKAFQRRFRQDLINGKIDEECLLISKNLLKTC